MMYSQGDEERVLLEIFGDKTDGFFLDIGAYDGEIFSNTRALALKGWSGICVEPAPSPLWALAQLYRDNPKVKVIGALVCELYPVGPEMAEFWATADGLSTTEVEHREKWKGWAPDYSRMYLPRTSIDKFTANNLGKEPIDLVSIDTEGTTKDLLNDYVVYLDQRPKVIVAEHDNQECDLRKIMDRVGGYVEAHRTNENLIWVKA